ncbi:hypothetical protein MTO96_032395 [Rhipicephalus appendiculatus]
MIYYSDYVNCVVADLELQGDGHQCTLWTRPRFKNNVPQNCIDQFVDVCGVVVPEHSRDLCGEVDDKLSEELGPTEDGDDFEPDEEDRIATIRDVLEAIAKEMKQQDALFEPHVIDDVLAEEYGGVRNYQALP